MNQEQLHYYEQLSELYPTIRSAASEIINLQSILHLPKGTEHFLSDIHGEYEAFSHVLRNGSGAVRKKIDDVFGNSLDKADKESLATLIYYPRERIRIVKRQVEDMENWYKVTLYRLIEICKKVSSKYTRSKVRKSLPADYAYVIEELITEKQEVMNKEAYYEAIIDTIVELGQTDDFVVALAELIQRLVIDHLHILGDMFDRGPQPHLIMERLMRYHSFDIQWGNHDIVWMGAATGHLACIAAVIRSSIRYGNIDLLEEGYGINLLPLATFAMKQYADDPCERFIQKNLTQQSENNDIENQLTRKMHKAISIIRFKLEGQLVEKYPEFHMDDRKVFDLIDWEKNTILIDGTEHPLLDCNFPTVDREDPYTLTKDEKEVMSRLSTSFLHSEILQRHMKLLLKKGSMYKVYNGNLLFHGCVPMNEDGSFRKVTLFGEEYWGKSLYDVLEKYIRRAFLAEDEIKRQQGQDIIWFCWTAPDSPLYGRHKMATFERYFLKDHKVKEERKNPYYEYIDNPEYADKVLEEFGVQGESVHIINGHVPVLRLDGENPAKSNGKVLFIDGGFSKTYQHKTGIAGYTLTYNSYTLALTAHQPFESADMAVQKSIDIESSQEMIEVMSHRVLVGDTDDGIKMKKRIEELKTLIKAYQSGAIVERDK